MDTENKSDVEVRKRRWSFSKDDSGLDFRHPTSSRRRSQTGSPPPLLSSNSSKFDAPFSRLGVPSLRSGLSRSHPDLHHAMDVATQWAGQAEAMMMNVLRSGWHVVQHHSLPDWMRDNEYLLCGHRPELNDFRKCFSSIFRLHTETINIWTHLIGFVAFLLLTIYSLAHPDLSSWEEKGVYAAFCLCAAFCMGFSWVFHTVYCHSERVSKLFNKLDYSGITFLTWGSFLPYIYYAFYCYFMHKVFYMGLITILSILCLVASTVDVFGTPGFRSLRAGIFVALGLSGTVPCTHYVLLEGLHRAFHEAALGWLVLMGGLYISGAVIYALRVPERLFPGKFDIWFQSHQIFHVLVVAAALVHFHGINQIAYYTSTSQQCPAN